MLWSKQKNVLTAPWVPQKMNKQSISTVITYYASVLGIHLGRFNYAMDNPETSLFNSFFKSETII